MDHHGPSPTSGRVRGERPRGGRGGWSRLAGPPRRHPGRRPRRGPGRARNPDAGTAHAAAPAKKATPAMREEFKRELAEQQAVLTGWWLRRMVAVRQPLREKLTLLWHNHFATSARKVRVPAYLAAQNQKLRTLALGDFRTLAYAMLTDAAMLRWLDGQSNTAKAANENLAREFMELFALGHGNGYTEDDVRAGARALTGWVIGTGGHTMMLPRRHDFTAKTLFGATGNFDAAGFCDAVLAQPKSAQHVAGRLWQQLAADEPPPRRCSTGWSAPTAPTATCAPSPAPSSPTRSSPGAGQRSSPPRSNGWWASSGRFGSPSTTTSN
ncbi:hypothetical protein BZL30_7242 [Mycobacterium kansasii]|uniref:DUF1800 domain-containing protein n=1 Tax=Mycobacterium kansasii TaxID=1768 RepID=A0A1V3WPC7_MYCKA|nr:hypothetical protein BZL30_7242 [Mycobacterium kansasii]